MTRILFRLVNLVTVALFATSAAIGQGQGSGSTTPPPSTTPPSGSTQRGTTRAPSRPADQFRGPLFIGGRVMTGVNRPVTEPVSVELNCGMKPLQVIHTDLGGYFTFTLGSGGFQSNTDFSASNESPQSFSSSMNNLPNRYGNSLAGCELRISVPGYHPLNYTLTQHADMGRIEIGTLLLNRIGEMKGSGISVTSLLVPKDASKEFEKALKEVRNNKPEVAQQHLEKAVALYDKYAAAWNELGRIYLSRNEKQKASEAFEKAIAADAEYIPPFLHLATLQVQNREWEKAVETSGRALELDSSIGFASFLQAVSNFNLNQLDAAEKSAHDAEKGPHSNLPQVHALLAEIYLHKQDYPQAATHMRTYLQESPEGQFAQRMKESLEQIESLSENPEGKDKPPAPPGS